MCFQLTETFEISLKTGKDCLIKKQAQIILLAVFVKLFLNLINTLNCQFGHIFCFLLALKLNH